MEFSNAPNTDCGIIILSIYPYSSFRDWSYLYACVEQKILAACICLRQAVGRSELYDLQVLGERRCSEAS